MLAIGVFEPSCWRVLGSSSCPWTFLLSTLCLPAHTALDVYQSPGRAPASSHSLMSTYDATSLVLMCQRSAAASIPGIITAAQKNGSATALEHMRLLCTLTQSQFYSRSNPCQCFFVLALQARLERCISSRSPATSPHSDLCPSLEPMDLLYCVFILQALLCSKTARHPFKRST